MGVPVTTGAFVGACVGLDEGAAVVGEEVGPEVGCIVGTFDGAGVGLRDGAAVVGAEVGPEVG